MPVAFAKDQGRSWDRSSKVLKPPLCEHEWFAEERIFSREGKRLGQHSGMLQASHDWLERFAGTSVSRLESEGFLYIFEVAWSIGVLRHDFYGNFFATPFAATALTDQIVVVRYGMAATLAAKDANFIRAIMYTYLRSIIIDQPHTTQSIIDLDVPDVSVEDGRTK